MTLTMLVEKFDDGSFSVCLAHEKSRLAGKTVQGW